MNYLTDETKEMIELGRIVKMAKLDEMNPVMLFGLLLSTKRRYRYMETSERKGLHHWAIKYIDENKDEENIEIELSDEEKELAKKISFSILI